jgi:hypothetical protein
MDWKSYNRLKFQLKIKIKLKAFAKNTHRGIERILAFFKCMMTNMANIFNLNFHKHKLDVQVVKKCMPKYISFSGLKTDKIVRPLSSGAWYISSYIKIPSDFRTSHLKHWRNEHYQKENKTIPVSFVESDSLNLKAFGRRTLSHWVPALFPWRVKSFGYKVGRIRVHSNLMG